MGREVSQAGVRVAVDIGGTFTDIVLMSPDGVLSGEQGFDDARRSEPRGRRRIARAVA